MEHAQFIQTISSTAKTSSSLFGWHWKANVESRGKIYNVQELKTLVRLSSRVQSDPIPP